MPKKKPTADKAETIEEQWQRAKEHVKTSMEKVLAAANPKQPTSIDDAQQALHVELLAACDNLVSLEQVLDPFLSPRTSTLQNQNYPNPDTSVLVNYLNAMTERVKLLNAQIMRIHTRLTL